ncbi:MAG: Mut7-C RNAse domain-containing protein [Proteobacteria bacterium]|nr:Mut7-C RNAse domain-containing protein [Pseudomonadota bacterium]MBU1739688.1 Mut7-C RNAse domain-containing protein [Pseudomonadota bacterium]
MVLERLEPLTRKYYADFHHCPMCARIYWPGSHRDIMPDYLQGISHERYDHP